MHLHLYPYADFRFILRRICNALLMHHATDHGVSDGGRGTAFVLAMKEVDVRSGPVTDLGYDLCTIQGEKIVCITVSQSV